MASSKSDTLSDQRIIECWKKNVAPWTQAVRGREIESREKITNQAILDTVCALAPTSALDLGCGEGWLTRALAQEGINMLGVDAVNGFIDVARAAEPEKRKTGPAPRYRSLSYEQIIAGALTQTFDTVICNFSLIGHESVDGLFQHFPALLTQQGRVVIQTLHPLTASQTSPYRSGWRKGSWDGFNDMFTDPAPWYFRTLEEWRALFHHAKLTLQDEICPTPHGKSEPSSIIFVAQA